MPLNIMNIILAPLNNLIMLHTVERNDHNVKRKDYNDKQNDNNAKLIIMVSEMIIMFYAPERPFMHLTV
jgi:hypothetical protein